MSSSGDKVTSSSGDLVSRVVLKFYTLFKQTHKMMKSIVVLVLEVRFKVKPELTSDQFETASLTNNQSIGSGLLQPDRTGPSGSWL